MVVTGANGFIAQHCVAALLSAGYRVLGTVRSASKAALVTATHNNPKLSTAIVDDITSTEAYRAAMQGVTPAAIMHLASPFTYDTRDYEKDLMVPAVRGALAVMEVAAGIKSIRRVVQTNSFACLYDAAAGMALGKTYSARDWSPLTYEDGVNATNAPTAYRASKTAAEKAAWDFIKTQRPQFDLVSLCPAMVFGAFLPGALPPSIEHLNTSNSLVHAVVSAGETAAVPGTKGPVWVDVRDVADAHVRSLTTPDAGGSRFLLAAGVYCNQELADVSREVLGLKNRSRIPVGQPGKREAHLHFGVDSREAQQVLGMEWRGLADCLERLVPQLYEIERIGQRL